jgi:hypothetical protein
MTSIAIQFDLFIEHGVLEKQRSYSLVCGSHDLPSRTDAVQQLRDYLAKRPHIQVQERTEEDSGRTIFQFENGEMFIIE